MSNKQNNFFIAVIIMITFFLVSCKNATQKADDQLAKTISNGNTQLEPLNSNPLNKPN